RHDKECVLQKLLLPDAPHLATRADPEKVERFVGSVVKKNGKQYYEFGPQNSRHHHVISGPTFDAKSVTLLVKNRISEKHWVNESVIESKMRWAEVQEIVSDCLKKQDNRIYNYMSYLLENRKR
ncbi:uncharacterized protein LOC117191577, partial [Drosophila miranda]|uniref:uncharacterized protein LOC117191577 n=1 Tax=Drosophila miranda TaxID=7229 RepID=UPI00143F68DD